VPPAVVAEEVVAEELFRELAEGVGLALRVSRLRLVVFDFGGAVTSTCGRRCTELPTCARAVPTESAQTLTAANKAALLLPDSITAPPRHRQMPTQLRYPVLIVRHLTSRNFFLLLPAARAAWRKPGDAE
jgi:hypothetical protein